MRLDCIKHDTCNKSGNECNDECEDLEVETNPLTIAENRACSEYHYKKDMEGI